MPDPRTKPQRILLQSTIRDVPFYYLHLTLLTASIAGAAPSIDEAAGPPPIDEITVRTHLTTALRQFLGLTGTAIPVDILRCAGRDAWVRVPAQDAAAAVEALSGWVGSEAAWRVRRSGSWLGGLVLGDGVDLFGE